MQNYATLYDNETDYMGYWEHINTLTDIHLITASVSKQYTITTYDTILQCLKPSPINPPIFTKPYAPIQNFQQNLALHVHTPVTKIQFFLLFQIWKYLYIMGDLIFNDKSRTILKSPFFLPFNNNVPRVCLLITPSKIEKNYLF